MIENHYDTHFKNSYIHLPDSKKWVEDIVKAGGIPANEIDYFYDSLLASPTFSKTAAIREIGKLSTRVHYAVCELLKKLGKEVLWGELIHDQEFTQLCNIGADFGDPGDPPPTLEQKNSWVGANGSVIHALASFENAGKRSYEVSTGLADKLLHTELRGLRSEDLRLPYEAIYIQIPSQLEFFIESNHDEKRIITGAYLIEVGGEKNREWYISAFAQSRTVPFGGTDYQNHSVIGFNVDLTEGLLLDDTIKKLAEINQQVSYHGIIDDGGSHSSFGDFFRWCMNLMLYATWSDAEVDHVITNREARNLWKRVKKLKRGSKKTGLMRKMNSLNPRNRIILGKSIVVNRQETREGGASGIGQPLMIRTRVSGHWRNQPYGPSHSLRRRQWIEPFWRGPEDGIAGSTTHVLKTTDFDSERERQVGQ